MTITEKILAAHSGRDKVSPGELINAKLDIVLANDSLGENVVTVSQVVIRTTVRALCLTCLFDGQIYLWV